MNYPLQKKSKVCYRRLTSLCPAGIAKPCMGGLDTKEIIRPKGQNGVVWGSATKSGLWGKRLEGMGRRRLCT